MTATPPDLRTRIDRLPPEQRRVFRRRLEGSRRISSSARRSDVLGEIGAEVDALLELRARRAASVPTTLAYPEDLPITDRRRELLDTIRDHQVVIVAGETGSGKSTQLPKLCLELGRGIDGLIGHTQPRRIAARSIAERIAEETATEVGGLVGYAMRFTDRVGDETLVKVMTDGILLAEIQRSRRLRAYDTIIIDEAHERSLNIDFLLGYLKALLPRRPDLKLIVTSATIDTARFSEHFGDAPVVEVSGRTYPVEMRYRPLDDPSVDGPRDQPQAICDAVVELSAEGTGDILVFCSGEREIRDAADALRELDLRHTEILPLYARLSSAEQHRVFEPHRGRRIVLATNVAETSLTVPGIRYVVDPGTARISRFSRRTKVQQLPIEPISQASADQRAGRCGRLGPGICIRLFAEDDYLARPRFTEPEIQRTSLASVILQMAAIGLGEVEAFPFLDPPDTRAIRDGIVLLEELGAVDPDRRGTGHWLTRVGKELARLPLDPRLGRMLIEAARNGCLREVAVIAAALSIQDPRERPRDHEEKADGLHARFVHPESDFLTWLRLWEYVHGERRSRTTSQFRRMCRDEFLNYRRLREWQDVHTQLRQICKELGYATNRTAAEHDVVHRSVLAGLLSHIGMRDPDGYEYRGARGARFSIAPGSTQFKRAPRWVMAGELVETTRLWARVIAPIDPLWAEELAGTRTRTSYSDPWWDRDRGAAVTHQTVTLYGLPLVTDRVVPFDRIDPAGARAMFISHALVAGEWETTHAFAEHNAAVLDAAAELETRARSDLIAEDEHIAGFFDTRLPDDVTSTRHFDAWWRRTRAEAPELLDLAIDDVLDPRLAAPDEEEFPQVWRYGDVEAPITYQFAPGAPTDGITIDVPAAGLDRIDPAAFDWLVPGLQRELLTALVRTLPKPIRRSLVPIPDTIDRLLESHRPEPGTGLVPYLRRELGRLADQAIPPDAFDLDRLPDHLRPRFRIVDGSQVLAEGSDLEALKARVADRVRATIDAATHPLETQGLTAWTIGELPHRVTIGRFDARTVAYPALVDEGDSVAVRLMGTEHEQAEAMWRGTRRLLALQLRSPRRLVQPMLTPAARAAITAGPHEEQSAWLEDCIACALDAIIQDRGGPAWDATGFDRLVAATRDQFGTRLPTIAEQSIEVLTTASELRATTRRLAAGLDLTVRDVRRQVGRLVYPGFLTAVGADRLDDVARYLAAARYRIDRAGDNLERDLLHLRTVAELEAEHERLSALLPRSAALADVAWLLEELRVSLFAQRFGTSVPVSEKRVRAALEAAALET